MSRTNFGWSSISTYLQMSEILSHSFFSRDTPGIYYTPPPSVSALQAPLLSVDDVDQDVLSSLRIIFGKHASRAVILNELLQDAPNCAKAFYVLLLKFRDRQMENFNGNQEDDDSKTGLHPYQSPRIQPVDHPTVPTVSLSPDPTPVPYAGRPTHTRTRSSPSKRRSAPVDMRPHLSTMSGTRPRLPLPLNPVPSYATATNASKSRESALLSPKLPVGPTPPVPVSLAPPYDATVSSPALTRPLGRRRETTSVTRSLGLGLAPPTSPPATGLTTRSKARRRDTSPSGRRPSFGLGITTPVPPTPPTPPPPTPALALASASHKLYPVQGSYDITVSLPVARVRRATSPAPPPFLSLTASSQQSVDSSVPLSPRTVDPDTQSAVDGVGTQARVLGALENAAQPARDHATHEVLRSPAILQEVQKPSRGSVGDGQPSLVYEQPDHSHVRPSHHSTTKEKENDRTGSPQRGRAGSEGTRRTPGSFKLMGRSNHVLERTECATVAEEKENGTAREVKRSRAGSEGAFKRGMVRKSRRKRPSRFVALVLKTIF